MEHHKKRLQEIAKRSNRTSTKEEELVRFAKNKQAIHLIEQASKFRLDFTFQRSTDWNREAQSKTAEEAGWNFN